ncbi:TPA: hypothetical protein ACGW44_005272 [Bacillus toyonensis]
MYQFLDIPSLVEMQGITPPNRALRKEDFITKEEEKKLKNILCSSEGLSEEQLSVRPLLIDRNVSILSLLLDYGFTLQELVSLQMHFGKNMTWSSQYQRLLALGHTYALTYVH